MPYIYLSYILHETQKNLNSFISAQQLSFIYTLVLFMLCSELHLLFCILITRLKQNKLHLSICYINVTAYVVIIPGTWDMPGSKALLEVPMHVYQTIWQSSELIWQCNWIQVWLWCYCTCKITHLFNPDIVVTEVS